MGAAWRRPRGRLIATESLHLSEGTCMRLPIFRLMAIAVLCLVPAVALAQQDVQQPTSTLPPETIAAIDAVIAGQMQEQELVGVSLGVIYDGQIAYLKGYGLADIE